MSDSSSSRPTATAADVDRMIQERQHQRSRRACYPCARRKVKCDQHQPCKTCLERSYPDLCSYDLKINHGARLRHPRASHGPAPGHNERPSRRPSSPASPAVADEPRPILPEHLGISRTPEEAVERETTFMGDNAVPSVIGSRSGQSTTNTDIPMVLGLQNSLLYYPFMEPLSADEIKQELYKCLPSYHEVQKYFYLYRTMVYPFMPIVTAIDEFEAYICTYLELAFHWEPSTPEKLIMKHQGPYQAAGQISLLLATLASGVLYSDLAVGPRRDLAQRFTRDSFQCLRLANFILAPSECMLESLLILGNVLQDVGQNDGAYAMLGTTVRLAESLGCHSSQRLSRLPFDKKQKRQRLWFSTVFSDCLLSSCYDRPPATTLYRHSFSSHIPETGVLGYLEAMYRLCDMGLASFMIDKDPENIPARISLLKELDQNIWLLRLLHRSLPPPYVDPLSNVAPASVKSEAILSYFERERHT
ncbi:uncharacterized protein K452DRAFT_41087 [Aplosporella prunicola CBS 121167]|uniref:Zn(2)-C6 fungal-type domain-containing protein n=1 Tax=Aplosporella prunicola CBS 121167 TaxID=1176127 RepID=A0A6A6AWB7_9PEZI|nr:uncharacterized protein K452DRAFT_41087 [Aplosporella prunicola CBS 121167]KAF2135234.1 hypothetical protein K452DRAFT_41087 [Aplosporella prunicola CBS 121167]